jgi:hypothetical protein
MGKWPEEATRSATAVSFARDELSVEEMEQLTRVLGRMLLCVGDFEDTRPADDA